jgi:hypothetical protein
MGRKYMIDYSYSDMLTMIGVTFLYGAGNPILYAFAALYFIVTFWVEKLLILKFYKKPIAFDSHLASSTVGWFKYILIAHMIFTYLQYSNAALLGLNILRFSDGMTAKELDSALKEQIFCKTNLCKRDLSEPIIKVYFFIMAAAAIAICLWEMGFKYCYVKVSKLFVKKQVMH